MTAVDTLPASHHRAPPASRGLARAADRIQPWLAWTVWGLILLAVSSLAVGQDRATPPRVAEAIGWVVGMLAVGSLGAVAVSMRRARLQSWLLLGYASFWSVGLYAYHTLQPADGVPVDLDTARRTIAVGDTAYVLGLHSLLFLLLIVPTGRLLSIRWRPLAWLVGASAALWSLQSIVFAQRVTDVQAYIDRASWASLSGVELSPQEELLFGIGQPIMTMLFIVPMIALLYQRARSARGEERQQLKWVALGGVGMLVALALFLPQPDSGWMRQAQRFIPGLASAWLAMGFAFAIFKYRLWDIDLVVRRSLVYGVMWLVIAAVYAGVAAGLGLAAGANFPIEVAVGLTVGATLVFQPARRWLERVADRSVFGRRDSAVEAIQSLGEIVETADRPRDIARELAAITTSSVRLGWAEVEIDRTIVATRGVPSAAPVISTPIVWRGEEFGTLRCRRRRGDSLDDEDVAVLNALVSQAALAISHARLTTRIVQTQEQERRRIERDIHDGAQQDLAALIARLGLARTRTPADGPIAETLAWIQHDVRRILADLRELAQGIHPSVLRDGGLVAAIEDRCARLPIDVVVRAPETLINRRFSGELEMAAYFCVTEGLTNALKHAGARSVEVSLALADGSLRVAVSDDGRGLDSSSQGGGSGLAGLSDRIHALGGTMRLSRNAGGGTRLEANLPVTNEASS
jgi:signal transduction histidine kinase